MECPPSKSYMFGYVSAELTEDLVLDANDETQIIFDDLISPIYGNTGLYNIEDGIITINCGSQGMYFIGVNITAESIAPDPDWEVSFLLNDVEVIQKGYGGTKDISNINISRSYPLYEGDTVKIFVKNNTPRNVISLIPETNLSLFRVAIIPKFC